MSAAAAFDVARCRARRSGRVSLATSRDGVGAGTQVGTAKCVHALLLHVAAARRRCEIAEGSVISIAMPSSHLAAQPSSLETYCLRDLITISLALDTAKLKKPHNTFIAKLSMHASGQQVRAVQPEDADFTLLTDSLFVDCRSYRAV